MGGAVMEININEDVDRMWQETPSALPGQEVAGQERGLADGVDSGPVEGGGCDCEGPGRRSAPLLNVQNAGAGRHRSPPCP